MSNSAQRYSGHGARGVKGTGKRQNRNTNNRENKKNHVGGSEPKQKWDAYIMQNRKKINLGKYDTREDAILAREQGELKYYGFIKEVHK